MGGGEAVNIGRHYRRRGMKDWADFPGFNLRLLRTEVGTFKFGSGIQNSLHQASSFKALTSKNPDSQFFAGFSYFRRSGTYSVSRSSGVQLRPRRDSKDPCEVGDSGLKKIGAGMCVGPGVCSTKYKSRVTCDTQQWYVSRLDSLSLLSHRSCIIVPNFRYSPTSESLRSR